MIKLSCAALGRGLFGPDGIPLAQKARLLQIFTQHVAEADRKRGREWMLSTETELTGAHAGRESGYDV
jgi:hypothetical protein